MILRERAIPKTHNPYIPGYNHLDAFSSYQTDVMIEGPYYTGKDRCMMEKLHQLLCDFPGSRALIARKNYAHLVPLLDTIFDTEVLTVNPLDDAAPVKRLGKTKPYAYEYSYQKAKHDACSIIEIRSLSNPDNIRGPGWNFGGLTQAEECTADDFMEMSGRMRRVGPSPFNQMLANCNPDRPDHWINTGEVSDALHRIVTRHTDNPLLYDFKTGKLTKEGRIQIDKLKRLPPIRREQGLYGRWAGGAYQVLDFQPALHVIPNRPIPKHWQRICAIDWGIRDPFVCLWIAIDPADRDMYVYRQIYQTNKTKPQHLQDIKRINAKHGEFVSFYICDPADAEGIQQFVDAGLNAIGGNNDLRVGLDAFQDRLKLKVDGKPSFYILENTLVELDYTLLLDHDPTELKLEFPHYQHRKRKPNTVNLPIDQPVGHHHAIDAARYAIMFVDEVKVASTAVGVAKHNVQRF